MTDGRRSHGHLMPAEELVDLRMAEAQAAADKLGVASEDVIFLGLEDGRLADQLDAAVPKVAEVLARCRPDQVFLPYRHEPPEDHAAAYHAVSKALSSHDRPVTAYEYPVWFWCHWPWATWPWFRRRQVVRRWGHGITSTIRLRRDFRIVVNIRDVLPAKREAMACYRTQMTQVLPGVGWRTFDDVSDGEFLDCCFQEHEFFMRYTS
jgi:LmbE family N-acetylglucosaminyl deacetylase